MAAPLSPEPADICVVVVPLAPCEVGADEEINDVLCARAASAVRSKERYDAEGWAALRLENVWFRRSSGTVSLLYGLVKELRHELARD